MRFSDVSHFNRVLSVDRHRAKIHTLKVITVGVFAGLSWGVTIADIRDPNLRLPFLGPIAFLIAFAMIPIVLVVPLVYGADRARLLNQRASGYEILFGAFLCTGLSVCGAVITAVFVLGLFLVL